VLRQRNGRPFVEVPPSVEEIAAVAAVLQNMMSPTRTADEPAAAAIPQRWREQARSEGLRV